MHPTVIHGQYYIFLDTPGFGAADLDDMAAFQTMTGLSAIDTFVPLVGIINVLDTTADRLLPPHEKTLKWIEGFCGTTCFKQVTIQTTKWDRLSMDDIEDQKIKLRDWEVHLYPLLNPGRDIAGATLYYHGIPDGGKTLTLGHTAVNKEMPG
jgi:hypothetical protein